MLKILAAILDFIFPPRCPVCGELVSINGQICGACWNKLNWIGDPKCAKCGYPFPANLEHDKNMLCPDCAKDLSSKRKPRLDWMRAASVYDDASRDMMLPFKHGGKLQFGIPMSRAMTTMLGELPTKELIVMPVPLAYRRLWKRGYNQAALLARPIAKHIGVSIDYNSVKRIHRADMGHKNRAQRKRNIAGVFRVRCPNKVRGRAILLVDDVCTTGATMDELAKVLKKAGAKWVGGITFCRTVRAI